MFKRIVRSVFRSLKSIQDWAEGERGTESTYNNEPINSHQTLNKSVNTPMEREIAQHKVINVWDYLTFREGTQAFHITKALDFEEWVTMEEILNRVNELFGARYQNERSLYPYLKTLVDAGLLEASMLGGKMRWRKKSMLHAISLAEEERELETAKPLQRPQ